MATLTGTRLLAAAERRRAGLPLTDDARRTELGQVLTPPAVAEFMASLFDLTEPGSAARLLDPGAGVGSLAAAFVDRWTASGDGRLHLTAVELDHAIQPHLSATLTEFEERGINTELVSSDFLAWALERVSGFEALAAEPYDFCIMNPPYRKVQTRSSERQLLAHVGVDVTNLYTAFVALAMRLLRPGGQLVAITPRSFANGPYFRAFRRDFLSHMAFRQIHLYDSRDTAFADSEVLQENVIVHAVRGAHHGIVRLTSSHSAEDPVLLVREVGHDDIVKPDDPDLFLHLTTDELAAKIAARMGALPASPKDVGVSVSTGRVVDFRTRPNLRDAPSAGDAPLIYPNHFQNGGLRWPLTKGKKPNALAVNDETKPLLLPNGTYVLVKRFTSKEERRRVVAVVTDSTQLPGEVVAFENHLNVFHQDNGPLEPDLALGLAAFLNSTAVDVFFRQWSGHTQVNATDLRSLRYPTRDELVRLGAAVGRTDLPQDKIDELVAAYVPHLDASGGADPLMAHQRIIEAQDVLRQLGMPAAQTNERSALTLLALLDLTPGKQWADIEAPLRGITPIMDFMAAHYGKNYAPNTRETVRRQTMHQFVAAGIAVQNPDDPTRATNSAKNVYQVPAELIDVLRHYGSEPWHGALGDWRAKVPALKDRWAREREMAMVAVTLPGGREVLLSPGGQNPLIKAIVDDFCPRYVPGGHVLYIGDTGDKFAVWEQESLADLGVVVNEHGKMPDVVVYDKEHDWLVLIEAATSHGPVDAKRHEELAGLFAGSRAGLVYVTAFMDRRTLGEYLSAISWETEVWVAEAPTHMIHFDGERYLGPYT
jgi:adenine-specific DNA-methyltransferase